MELKKNLEKSYNIQPIIKIEKTDNGSGNTYHVETTQEKYIAKMNERIDFVEIYYKVQHVLNQKNLLQSRIIRTKEDLLTTSEGIVLYEFIKGDNYLTLTKNQCKNALKYIRKYNDVLKTIPFNNAELKVQNHWDMAKSTDFIIYEFPDYLNEANIDNENKWSIYCAIDILSRNEEKFLDENKQLIHSDLGADNFIFNGDEISSIIDFTPEYNHELYSLCQFIYWNYLWDNQNINKDEIDNYLRIYYTNENERIDNEIFYAYLIKAVLFRIIGPLIEVLKKDNGSYDVLNKRFKILDDILRVCTEEFHQ